MQIRIDPTPCEACFIPFNRLLAIKCPHCGEINGADFNVEDFHRAIKAIENEPSHLRP